MQNKIITISREFGSGGRELGKRMADILGFAYYDREIITAVAEHSSMDETYVEQLIEKNPLRSFPITVGRTFSYLPSIHNNEIQILLSQQHVIKELTSQGNCIIIGQAADWIIKENNPFNIFVYSDLISKINRCRERETEHEHLSHEELRKKIQQVDLSRKKRYELVTSQTWGQKDNYHLCINTSNMSIKRLAFYISKLVECYFSENKLGVNM